MLEILFFPPGVCILLYAVALVFWSKRMVSFYFTIAATILLYISSITLVSDPFLRMLEYPPLDQTKITTSGAQAIVIIGAGRYPSAPEYDGRDSVSNYSMQRIRYAAWLAKQANLPILVSGGNNDGESTTEAELMKQVLENEFNVKVGYLELDSRTTYENAVCSKEILDTLNAKKVFLITQAWHMPRAVSAFKHAGIEVVPAPTGFTTRHKVGFQFRDILPRSEGMRKTNLWLHEALGYVWYKFKYVGKPKACVHRGVPSALGK